MRTGIVKKIVVLAFIIILIIVIVITISFCAYSCNYKYQESDFVLEISVNKTVASIGDTIEITAELKNLSGRSLLICINNNTKGKLEKTIFLGMSTIEENAGGIAYDLPYKRRRRIFKKNESVINKESFIIEEGYFPDGNIVDLFAGGWAYFYVGNFNSENHVCFFGEAVKITIIKGD